VLRHRCAAVLRPVALVVWIAGAGFIGHAASAGHDEGDVLAQGNSAPPRQAGEPVNAQDAERRARGKAVFDEWCAGCHAPGPRHPGTQALDALYRGKKPGALEARTDLVPKLTETFVRKGVSVMAPFRKTEISDAQLADLAAYLSPRPR
jgi:mono/diheme cytochrome c family protein